MARQSQAPVEFNRTTRGDRRVGMTTGRAGVVLPIDYIPVLRGDSVAGSFQAQFNLAEMPKPLMNAVQVRVQAWFVPKSAYPQFSGYDEFMHSFQGDQIKALNQADRDPPPFYNQFAPAKLDQFRNSTFLTTLGVHLKGQLSKHNLDILDAYNLVWNFRAAAHSSRIERRSYSAEDPDQSMTLAPAFWPSGKFRHVVPDYERALIVGAMDLDVSAGQMPVSGFGLDLDASGGRTITDNADRIFENPGEPKTYPKSAIVDQDGAYYRVRTDQDGVPDMYAEMAGETVATTLAEIDKARTTQAFAKLRTAYAGNDATGFDNDDTIVAELMQGLRVPEDSFKRPWLLDSTMATFGMIERHATDAANLDASVSTGKTAVNLSLNVPRQETGGTIIITAEVLPEQLHERQGDHALYIEDVNELPNALRDVQRPEPVDLVENWRIDARHSNPRDLYGYEPMNAVWDRDFTVLGGEFYQKDPSNPFTEARSAIWLAEVVDPEFTADHYVAPQPFPHDVFSDTLADAVEIAYRHSVSIRGLTQIGDVLAENNDDYEAVKDGE